MGVVLIVCVCGRSGRGVFGGVGDCIGFWCLVLSSDKCLVSGGWCQGSGCGG